MHPTRSGSTTTLRPWARFARIERQWSYLAYALSGQRELHRRHREAVRAIVVAIVDWPRSSRRERKDGLRERLYSYISEFEKPRTP